MASLQDQLLKAGLIDKNSAKKVSKEKHKASKTARKAGGKSQPTTQPETNAMKALNAERDRNLNRQKQEAAETKAIAAQILQLIDMNKIDLSAGKILYNFVHGNKVKKLHVTEDVQKQLGSGRLVIVKSDSGKQTRFEVVPKVVADKIAQRNASCIVQIASESEVSDEEDDTYAAFKVPDDLMW